MSFKPLQTSLWVQDPPVTNKYMKEKVEFSGMTLAQNTKKILIIIKYRQIGLFCLKCLKEGEIQS